MSANKYPSIALGGTFDNIHAGHKLLLRRAFDSAEYVVIGLTSDSFAASEGKKIEHDYDYRKSQLEAYLKKTYPGRHYTITVLESRFGPGIFTKKVAAIAVSEETLPNLKAANDKRRQMGLPEMKIEVVPMVKDLSGKTISSTRIRAGEIDSEGNPKK